MATQNLHGLARQGDEKAINALLHTALQSLGVVSKSVIRQGTLHVLLESSDPLDPDVAVPPVHDMIIQIRPTGVEVLTVYGRQGGSATWSRQVDLAPTLPTPPTTPSLVRRLSTPEQPQAQPAPPPAATPVASSDDSDTAVLPGRSARRPAAPPPSRPPSAENFPVSSPPRPAQPPQAAYPPAQPPQAAYPPAQPPQSAYPPAQPPQAAYPPAQPPQAAYPPAQPPQAAYPPAQPPQTSRPPAQTSQTARPPSRLPVAQTPRSAVEPRPQAAQPVQPAAPSPAPPAQPAPPPLRSGVAPDISTSDLPPLARAPQPTNRKLSQPAQPSAVSPQGQSPQPQRSPLPIAPSPTSTSPTPQTQTNPPAPQPRALQPPAQLARDAAPLTPSTPQPEEVQPVSEAPAEVSQPHQPLSLWAAIRLGVVMLLSMLFAGIFVLHGRMATRQSQELQAITKLTSGITTAETATSLQELENADQQLKQAIDRLQTLENQPGPLSSEIQTEINRYARQRQNIQQRLQYEEAATQALESARKLAQEAVQVGAIQPRTPQTLQQAQEKWQAALNQLAKIPTDTLVAEEVVRLQMQYQRQADVIQLGLERTQAVPRPRN